MRYALAVLLFASSAAMAEPYALASVGAARLATSAGTDTGFAMGVGAGYRFGRLALEVAISDIGDASSTTTSGPVITKQTWSGYGLSVGAVGGLSLSAQASLIASAGVQQISSKVVTSQADTSTTPATTTDSTEKSDLGWRPAFSVGLQYALADGFAVRWLVHHIDGDKNLRSARIFSLQLLHAF